MTRHEKLQKMSEAQLSLFIFMFLSSDNCPLLKLRTVSDIVGWLNKEWVDGEYGY